MIARERLEAGLNTAANEWAKAVNNYNEADAEWYRSRAALAELNRTDSKR